jgi:hypothetical protein
MKKISAFALSLVAVSLLGFEVEDNKKFTVKAAPTQMSAGVSFLSAKGSQAAVKSTLDSVLREVKSKNITGCKGGEYYIYPTSEYDQVSKKTLRKGYEGSIRFECRFADVAVYDGFLELINRQVKSKDGERIHIYPIVWELTEDEREIAGERLKMAALEYAPRRAAELSRGTKAACDLKKISFDAVDAGRYFPATRAGLSQTEAPIPEAKEVSINARMLFECKK